MKFRALPQFTNEFHRLPAEHRRIFMSLIPEFNRACDEYIKDPGNYVWPARLRVSQMTSMKGVWEMTWSFTGPDGRATFQFIVIGDERYVEWRRIGRHDIYKSP